MHYRLIEGVVLISMCGGFFIFPSRKSGFPPFIFRVSSGIADVLLQKTDPHEKLSSEEKKKLSQLYKCGYIEEFD